MSAQILYVEDTTPSEIAERIALKKQVGVMDWGDPEHMILVLLGDGKDPEVVRRINKIKGRPEGKVMAVAGFDKLVHELGEFKSPETISKLFQLPVGVLVPAKKHVPDWLTSSKNGQRLVMIAGQSFNPKWNYIDLFNPVMKIIADKFNSFCAATSANLSDELVYQVEEQELAYSVLGPKVDFFVFRKNRNFLKKPRKVSSSTVFDLSGETPVLTRWGSKDIKWFKSRLGKIIIPAGLSVQPGAEIFLSSLFRHKMSAKTRLKLARSTFSRK